MLLMEINNVRFCYHFETRMHVADQTKNVLKLISNSCLVQLHESFLKFKFHSKLKNKAYSHTNVFHVKDFSIQIIERT